MSKNITIAGASYSSVPSIVVPQTSGGTATFYDCTGSKSITENGTVDVTGYASAVVNVAGGGGGIDGVTELYSANNVSISYTSTSAGTAKTITGITGLCTYPIIVVIIENTDQTTGNLKFYRSVTNIGNLAYATSAASVSRQGIQQYRNSSGTLTHMASTSYGLWGYTISTSNSLTIRGRCNGSYYTSLTGTYNIRVLGVKF